MNLTTIFIRLRSQYPQKIQAPHRKDVILAAASGAISGSLYALSMAASMPVMATTRVVQSLTSKSIQALLVYLPLSESHRYHLFHASNFLIGAAVSVTLIAFRILPISSVPGLIFSLVWCLALDYSLSRYLPILEDWLREDSQTAVYFQPA